MIPYQIFRKQTDREKEVIELCKYMYGPFTYSMLPLEYPYHANNICWTKSTYQARLICAHYYSFCRNVYDKHEEFFKLDDFKFLDKNWTLFDKLMKCSSEEAILELSLNPIEKSTWFLIGLELSCAAVAAASRHNPTSSDTPLVSYEKWPENTRLAIDLCEQSDLFDECLADSQFWIVFNDILKFMSSEKRSLDEIKSMLSTFEERSCKAFKKRSSN